MRPKKHRTTGSGDLFRARLDQIINMKHELVQLAGKVDWDWIDGEIAPLYSENGRPGIATRFMIGLLLLKHIYGLSDEGVCERWVHDPYFQYFTGEEFFQHAFPHERSDLSHWRKRLGNKLELLLAESLRVAHEAGALRSQDLKRVTVDTTVQPKAITFPTDAKLLHAAIRGLNRLARKHGVRLRQSYLRIAKTAAMMAGRYAHAKQFKRHQRQLRILRSRLGRIIRDIRRKIEGQAVLENAFALPLGRASQIRSQQQRQRGWKLYSFHAPEVECIGKGKAAAPYEFGVKASIVTNNRRAPGGLFVLHASALPDNPYDGHTLRDAIDRTETLTGCAIERAYVDKGYRGEGPKCGHGHCVVSRAAFPNAARFADYGPRGKRSILIAVPGQAHLSATRLDIPEMGERRSGGTVASAAAEMLRGAGQSPSRPERRNASSDGHEDSLVSIVLRRD